MTQLPQLALLLRQYKSDQDNFSQMPRVESILKSLYETGDEVRDLLNECVTPVPTQCASTARFLPQSYAFTSPYDLDLAVHYFTYRILLLGMMQSFYHPIQPYGSTDLFSLIDISAVQQEEEIVSRQIAMYIQYSQRCPDAPCVPLRFKTVLRYGYGALNRIHTRKAAEGRVQESVDTARLKRFCYQSGVQTMRRWGVGRKATPSEEYFGAGYRSAVGGPPWYLEKHFDEDGSFIPD